MEKEKKLLEILTDIYIFIMVLLFPLIVDKTGFFHIFECKWNFFVHVCSIYILLSTLIIFFYLIFKKINIFKEIKMSKVHILVLLFLLINIISTILSPFLSKYNLFIGVGRGEGLLTMGLYSLSFLFVSLFGRFKKQYFMYFSIVSIILNLIAIFQYVGFNPFNMFQNGIGTHNVSFMTTIGNIDFISALYCILISISFSSFILGNNKKIENIIHLISVFLGFFIIGIIDVQSGKVAFMSTLLLFLPIFLINNKRFSKTIIMFSTILLSYCINIIINPEYHYSTKSLGLYFQFNFIVLLFIIICSILYFLANILNHEKYEIKNRKKFYKIYYLLLSFLMLSSVIILFIFDLNLGLLHEIHDILHGKLLDEYGTYRIFLWKRTIKLIPEHFLIGSGPDTFALRFMPRYTNDLLKIGPLTINDTAANVYLTMIINIGIIGLISYLLFLSYQIVIGIKKQNSLSIILLISIICYIIQDFFNLSLVIITPIFWLTMALHILSIKEYDIDMFK